MFYESYQKDSDVDRVLPLKSDQKRTLSVNLGALGNRALYLKNLNFLLLINIPSSTIILKLSENIYITGVSVKRPTVKQHQQMMVI